MSAVKKKPGQDNSISISAQFQQSWPVRASWEPWLSQNTHPNLAKNMMFLRGCKMFRVMTPVLIR